jgi:hypothetical protein
LTVFSPSVPIFQMINLALCHERESWLSLSLLICLLGFQPKNPTNAKAKPRPKKKNQNRLHIIKPPYFLPLLFHEDYSAYNPEDE